MRRESNVAQADDGVCGLGGESAVSSPRRTRPGLRQVVLWLVVKHEFLAIDHAHTKSSYASRKFDFFRSM